MASEIRADLIDDLEETTKITSRKIALLAGISQSTAYRILVRLNGPWRKTGKEAFLNTKAREKRVHMAKILLNDGDALWGYDWLKRVIWSDESYIEMTPKSIGNRGTYGRKLMLKQTKHPIKFMVFTAISHDGFCFWRIFPVNSARMTGQIYHDKILVPMVAELRAQNRLQTSIFMQDGAPCHTAKVNLAYLRNQFGNRLISLKESVEWAPSSPDINPLGNCSMTWCTAKLKIVV